MKRCDGSIAALTLAAILLAACGGAPAPAASTTPTHQTPTSAASTSAPSINSWTPGDMAIGPDGALYVSDCGNARIYRIAHAGKITVYAGSGQGGFTNGFSGDGGPAINAHFGCPYGLAFDAKGNLYVADHLNDRIRMIDRLTTTVSTVAGNGAFTSDIGAAAGDGGPATAASLAGPVGVAFDAAGNMYIGDRDHNAIRKVDTHGIITTVAGTGTAGHAGDGGPATKAELNRVLEIAFDRAGNMFIADENNARIRKVDRHGIITTVAGTGKLGGNGDGGPGVAAHVQNPNSIAFGPGGTLYFTEGELHKVRMLNTAGVISTAVGTGAHGCSGVAGGPAAMVRMSDPEEVRFDAKGNMYVSDQECGTVIRIDTKGIATVFASV